MPANPAHVTYVVRLRKAATDAEKVLNTINALVNEYNSLGYADATSGLVAADFQPGGLTPDNSDIGPSDISNAISAAFVPVQTTLGANNAAGFTAILKVKR